MAEIVKSTTLSSPKIIRTVVSGGGSPSAGRTVVSEFNLADLAEQGREQQQACQRQVDEMLESARQQAELIKSQAHEAGHAAGWQAAADEIEAHVDQHAEHKAKAHVESLHAAVVQMARQYENWMNNYAAALTTTAIAAAEHLTRSMLRSPGGVDHSGAGEHLILRWVREALHNTRSASRLTLAVHPETLHQLGPALHALLAHSDLPEESSVIGDRNLGIGDVVVRQDGGEIHAGLDAQLERLREELQ